MVDLRAKPYYLNDEDIAWVESTIASMTPEELEKAEKARVKAEKKAAREALKKKKQQEKIDTDPVRKLQPKDRSIRYENMRSARAEESIIAQILREPALLEQIGKLKQSDFSVELLGRVYGQLRSRYENGLEVSLGVLADLTPQEMSHVTMISQKQQGPVNEQALRDCVDTVLAERQRANVSTDDDLLALRNKLKESKGTKI